MATLIQPKIFMHTSTGNALIDEFSGYVEVLGYVRGRQVHELEAFVSDPGTVAVVKMICVHLRVALAFSCVQDVVDTHAS